MYFFIFKRNCPPCPVGTKSEKRERIRNSYQLAPFQGWKGGQDYEHIFFWHIVRIQFNALIMIVINRTVKSKKRQFARRSKREVLFCELSDMKRLECGTTDNYSCDYISFEVMNNTIQVSNEKLAVALHKLSEKQRDVILLRYF